MLKEYALAALQVKIAAKLTTGFNQSKTQRALVEAFLGNHQQVHYIYYMHAQMYSVHHVRLF